MQQESYIQKYLDLIESERQAQKEEAERKIKLYSLKSLEAMGVAVGGLKATPVGELFGMYAVRFGRSEPIRSEITVGDVLLVSKHDPLRSDLQAVVVKVGKKFIEAVFSHRPPKQLMRGVLRLDRYVNDITYKRMAHNLIQTPQLPAPALRDVVIGGVRSKALSVTFEPLNPKLNETQRKAVSLALGADPLVLIHGPAGTGKSTTLIEVIAQYCKQGKKVLAVAESNVAVDNLLEKIVSIEGIEAVRIGHPVRIAQDLETYSLASKLSKHPFAKKIQALQQTVEEQMEKRNGYTKPTPARLRGMSKDRIVTLAQKNKSMRGVDIETIKSMAQWILSDRKIQEQNDKIKALESTAIKQILDRADVVCTTNAMVGSEVMEGRVFDVSVVDEASQQIEPSTLMALWRAPKAILAGDHKQLPPTTQTAHPDLRRSLFERLMEQGNVPSIMLDMQYRMHPHIVAFPNRLMYHGRLRSHPSLKHRSLPVKDNDPAIDGTRHVIFKNINGKEDRSERGYSYRNEQEARYVTKLVCRLIQKGIEAKEIGVITPYSAQAKTIRSFLENKGCEHVEVSSVDGFQGREKEVIVVSFVRSNASRQIGFTADDRRLNTAMTRARSKLILVGDQETLGAHQTFRDLLRWLESFKAISVQS